MPKEFREKIDALPELLTYQKRIYDFMHLDKKDMNMEEVVNKYFEASGDILPFILKEVEASTMSSLTVYRVRRVREGDFFDNRLVRSLSYPDPSFMDKNGRANLKGTSVFYCADNWETAIREMEPKVGDKLFVSRWKIKTDRAVLMRAFLPHKSIPQESHIYEFAKKHFAEFQEWNKKNCAGKEEHTEYLNELIVEQFGFEQYPYHFSSWIANTLMYEHNGIDLLMYPSWKTQFIGCNYAIHPNFVDQYMSLEVVYEILVKELIKVKPGSEEKNSMKWSYGEMGIVDRTNIQWKWPTEQDVSMFVKNKGNTYDVSISPVKK